MGRTKRNVCVMGETVTVHKCNNCKKYLDGLAHFHWETKNFTLCVHCIANLAKSVKGLL